MCVLSLLLCLACHTSLTAENFPPILPRSQSEGSPPSLTRQGSFLSVLCRLAMCCSYSLDYLGCAKCHIRLFIFVYYLDRWVAIELRMLLSARCACGDSTQSSSWVYIYLFKQIILGCLIFYRVIQFWWSVSKDPECDLYFQLFKLNLPSYGLCTTIHSFYSPQLLWNYFLHFLCHSSRAKLPSMKGGRGATWTRLKTGAQLGYV